MNVVGQSESRVPRRGRGQQKQILQTNLVG